MKYHKIRNVPLEVCTAEAKIAYNLAFANTWDYREEYKKNANSCSRTEVSKFVTEAIAWCMKMLECSWDYQKILNKYDIDAIFCCLNAGMENYLKSKCDVLSSYAEIGKTFPSLYL